VIFIELNVDKIINAFTKIFFVNVVNVYHIYVVAHECLDMMEKHHLLTIFRVTSIAEILKLFK